MHNVILYKESYLQLLFTGTMSIRLRLFTSVTLFTSVVKVSMQMVKLYT